MLVGHYFSPKHDAIPGVYGLLGEEESVLRDSPGTVDAHVGSASDCWLMGKADALSLDEVDTGCQANSLPTLGAMGSVGSLQVGDIFLQSGLDHLSMGKTWVGQEIEDKLVDERVKDTVAGHIIIGIGEARIPFAGAGRRREGVRSGALGSVAMAEARWIGNAKNLPKRAVIPVGAGGVV
jgi:hypothetical protein